MGINWRPLEKNISETSNGKSLVHVTYALEKVKIEKIRREKERDKKNNAPEFLFLFIFYFLFLLTTLAANPI